MRHTCLHVSSGGFLRSLDVYLHAPLRFISQGHLLMVQSGYESGNWRLGGRYLINPYT
jgi:hypothetical protein